MKNIVGNIDLKKFIATLVDFAINDFKKKYSGSVLGIAWAYIQTIMMVVIYWCVFQFGLRVGGANGIPFLAWFIAGYMPWMLFSDIINSSIGCMSEYSYIVKKVVFNVNIIPLAKIVGCLFIHSVFVLIVIGIAFAYGIFTGVYLFQVIYYLLALLLLAVPLAFLCSTVNVFFKDFAQGVGIVLNILTWVTPILWDFSVVPQKLTIFFKLNPMFYIVSGFRDSILFGIGISERWLNGLYYWAIVLFLWIKCMKTYKELLPHMADVL